MSENHKKIITDAGRREKLAVFDKESAKWPWPELLKSLTGLKKIKLNDFLLGVENLLELKKLGIKFRVASPADFKRLAKLRQSAIKSLGKLELLQLAKVKSAIIIEVPDRTRALIALDNAIFKYWGDVYFLIGSGCAIDIIDRHQSGESFAAGSVYLASGLSSRVEYLSVAGLSAYGFNLRSFPGQGSEHRLHAVGKITSSHYHYNIESFMSAERSLNHITASMSFKNSSNSIIKLLNLHDATKTVGDIKFKGIGWDSSRSKVDGMIEIAKTAPEADSYLKEDIILASEGCSVKAEPNLEIKNDDVKASHGATMGFMDKSAIFYLMSRGLSKAMAEKLVADGFLRSLSKEIISPELRHEAINYWN